MGGQHHTLAALPLEKIPVTHCTGDWMGPRVGLDGKVKVGKIIQNEFLYGTGDKYGQVSIGTKYIQYSTLDGMSFKIKIFCYIENKLKSQLNHT